MNKEFRRNGLANHDHGLSSHKKYLVSSSTFELELDFFLVLSTFILEKEIILIFHVFLLFLGSLNFLNIFEVGFNELISSVLSSN